MHVLKGGETELSSPVLSADESKWLGGRQGKSASPQASRAPVGWNGDPCPPPRPHHDHQPYNAPNPCTYVVSSSCGGPDLCEPRDWVIM